MKPLAHYLHPDVVVPQDCYTILDVFERQMHRTRSGFAWVSAFAFVLAGVLALASTNTQPWFYTLTYLAASFALFTIAGVMFYRRNEAHSWVQEIRIRKLEEHYKDNTPGNPDPNATTPGSPFGTGSIPVVKGSRGRRNSHLLADRVDRAKTVRRAVVDTAENSRDTAPEMSVKGHKRGLRARKGIPSQVSASLRRLVSMISVKTS